MSVNDVTGDRMVTKVIKDASAYDKFASNWDAIFKKKTEVVETTKEVEDKVCPYCEEKPCDRYCIMVTTGL